MKKVSLTKSSKREKKKITLHGVLIIVFFVTLFFMTLGYASFSTLLDFSGTVIVKAEGKVYIKSVESVVLDNSTANPTIESDDVSIDFNLSFITQTNNSLASYAASFDVTLVNESFSDYTYTESNYDYYIVRGTDPNTATLVDNSLLNYEIVGLSSGDTIRSGEEVTFTVNFLFTNPDRTGDTYVVNGEFIPQTTEEEEAHLLASVVGSNPTGDLRGNLDIAEFDLAMVSTYNYSKQFTISLSSDKYLVTDSNGNALGNLTINANESSGSYKFYIKEKVGNDYTVDTERVTVYINSDNEQINAGRISLLVDKTLYVYDTTPPIITNVLATINNDDGCVDLTWHGEDDSNVLKYMISVYNANDGLVKTVDTNSDNEYYTVNGLGDGYNEVSYYFVVYGVDNSSNHNSGESYVATATNDYAYKSSLGTYRWQFRVTYTCQNDNISCPNQGTAYLNQRYTGPTFNVSGTNNTFNDTITVTMNGNDLTTNQYSWNRTNNNKTGQVIINANVINADVSITVDASGCLVEGTKVLLANGTYKNIEDIDYSDLLMIYDHKKGEISYAYPIWVEIPHRVPSYIKVTFSDNSYIDVATMGHSIFSVTLNKYVNMASSEFKVGSYVYKLKNNKLEKVQVKKIETIYEETRVYNLISVGYYNFIANDFLTQETFANATNSYTFYGNKAKYGIPYYLIKIGPKLPYSYFKNTVPYHIYKGSYLENAYTMIGDNFDEDFLRTFAMDEIKEPYKINNKNAWFVTTSLDDLTDMNKYLKEQGSIYTLPKSKNVKCYYNTYDDKCYKPGSKITINHSLHFIAK